jgi:hypothetical protein
MSVLEQAMATTAKPRNTSRRHMSHQKTSFRRGRSPTEIAAGVAASVFLLAGIAAAQTISAPLVPPSDPPVVAPAPAPPPATEGPGLAGVFGTWLQQGMTSMGNGFDAMMGAAKGAANAASSVAKGAADAAKGAADVAVDGVAKLPVAGVASGREQCAIAGNGAPDCQAAAGALCRARGYGTGASVDFVTAEKCQPPYRTSGRDTPEGACTLEHFVTRALCK